MDFEKQLEAAQAAAQEGRSVLKKYFRAPHTVEVKNAQHYNIVTQADIECEQAIVKKLQEFFPDYNILAEEHEYAATDSPFLWIIDSIDGTTNFSRGIPVYSISIALAYNNEIVVGLVWDVEHEEQFTAIKGKGARLNNEPIKVSAANNLTQSLIVTGFYYGRGEEMKKSLTKIEELLTLGITDIRRFGSAALDLCSVATGRMDGYFEYYLNPYDYAGGKLVLEEAGGTVTDLSGKKLGITGTYVVGTNSKIHRELLEILQ